MEYLSRRWLSLTLSVFASIGIPPAIATAATEYEVYRVEAEAFTNPAGTGVVADATASRGRAVLMSLNSAIARSSVTPTASRIVIRAAGDQCAGAPKMQLRLDGVLLSTNLVSATGWTNFSVSKTIRPGTHTISVKYTNDYVSSTCDRNIRVDYVLFKSTKAINVGVPGSRCEASDYGLATTSPPPDISTTWLGTAPAYYEYGEPTGAFAGLPPKGTALLIHGGAWYVVGPGAVATTRGEATGWRARGWAALSVTYRGCALTVQDVLWFHDAVRSRAGTLPICAAGNSAGGHLALFLASQRPLACAIGRGAPTDLAGLSNQTAYDPSTVGQSTKGSLELYYLAVAAFGKTQLTAMSPVTYADAVSTPLLLATAQHDSLVPLAQAADLASAVRATRPDASVEVLVLAPGSVPFVHAGVDQASADAYWAAEEALVTTAGG